MASNFTSAKNIIGKIWKTVSDDKRKLYYSIRVSITVTFVAMIYSRVIVQLGGFGNSVVCAAVTVLPTTELHVGETLIKAIINIVANILGVLLGYGLRTFSEYEIGKAKFAFLMPVIFTMIVMGILLRFVKVVKDKYDYGTSTFLQAMLPATLHLFGPDWINKEFGKNAITWGIAYALTVLSYFVPPFWAGVDVHYRVQEYLNTLADIFKGLDEECFRENSTYENLDDKLFLQPLQSVIDSKEKEKSLSKFITWEPRWHPQEQYEKIGDLSRRCASTVQSLSTYLTTENMHISPQLRETCKEICCESATALAHFSLSMKLKPTPAASINIHLATALKLASLLENTLEAKDITSRLVESVLIIKRLADSIEELARLVSFKQFEQGINILELVIRFGFPLHLIPAIQLEVAVRANQLVALMKKWVSRLLSYLEKFKTRRVSVSDGPDTTQPPVNLVPETTLDKLGQVAIDITPTSGLVLLK